MCGVWGVGTLLGFEETTGFPPVARGFRVGCGERGLFSWCCPSLGALCGVFGGGVGVLFENCIVDASIFVVFKNFTGFCVSF